MYTTKWLPVEGEIKKEDYYFFKNEPSNILQRTTSRDLTLLQNNLQKVKLFLISYDIKAGDKFISPSGNELVYDSKMQQHPDDYKVIGEISSDALSYVKADGEYTEEQWELWGHHTEGYTPGFLAKDCIKEWWCVVDYCKILGPCGHFH